MARGEKPISTMAGLLRAMTREYGSRKTGAILKFFRSIPVKIHVEEYFDDGKGHSGAFTSDRTDVMPEIFEQALRECYISGKLEPGYVSNSEFVITERGQQAYNERVLAADELLKQLTFGKGMRVCDLHPNIRTARISEEVVEEIMDRLVCEGYAESYVHGEQKFYLLAQQRKTP